MIDSHAHACGKYLKASSVIETLDKNKLSHVVLVPGEPKSTKEYTLLDFAKLFPTKNVVKITNVLSRFVIKMTGAIQTIEDGNAYVYSLSQQTGGRVIQFFWATQEQGNISSYLDHRYQAYGFKGVKLHQCWESFFIQSQFFIDVATWAEEEGLPLFIHLYSDQDVLNLIAYKKEHPDLKLIVAHLFGLELFIKEGFKDPNLYFDTSPYPLNSTERLHKAIKHVGADHVLMGSDTPYGKKSLEKTIERIKELELSVVEKNMILGDNMRKLLLMGDR